MSSPLMKGEDANFSEKAVQDIASKLIGRLQNVLAFYELYRDISLEKDVASFEAKNVLDVWILSRLGELVADVTKGMEAYDMTESTRPFDLFVDDLSTWYLRRSRERIKDGETDAKKTLYVVFTTVAKLLAPFAPFTAEDIWQRLKHGNSVDSVHLTEWPTAGVVVEEVLTAMKTTRMVVTYGLEARQKAGLKVRQPLAQLKAKTMKLGSEYTSIAMDELNVKEIVEDTTLETDVWLDTTLTDALKKEGEYRELVRGVQDLRKKEGLTPSDVVTLTLSMNAKDIVASFETEMKKTVLAREIVFVGSLEGGEAIEVAGATVLARVEK